MSTTVLDLITEALVRVKALAAGETAPADMANDALVMFNEVLESMSIQNLSIYSTTESTYPLINLQAVYTIGPTGDFPGVRPNMIDSAFVSYNNTGNNTTIDFPLELKTETDYSRIAVKETPGIPRWLVWNGTWPNGTVKLWPVPYDQPATITFYEKNSFAAATALTDTVDLPPGYRKMIRLLLAWELLSDYPGMTPVEIQKLGQDKDQAVALIKRLNDEPLLMRSEAAAMGTNGNNNNYVNWRDGA